MGREKTTSNTSSSQQTRVEPTAEEKRLNQLLLERAEAGQEGQIETQRLGTNLINQLLAGETLPGFLGTLPGGISSGTIGQESSRIALEAGPGFQNLGISDSGVAFRETAKDIANRVQFPAEQFNIGNLLNLLNLAVGGQAQIQAPLQAQSSQLSGALAGLRSINQTGTSSTIQTQMNPFLKSFQSSAGKFAGSLGGNTEAAKFIFS